MPNCKGTGISFLRSLFKQGEPGVEKRFLDALTRDEADLYQNTIPVAMVPLETAAKMYALAAPLLFPKDPEPLKHFGELAARSNLQSFHRVILRFTNIPFIAAQAAKLWSLHNDRGEAQAEAPEGEQRVVFTVRNFPELPATYREMLCGYVASLAKLSGAPGVHVKHSAANPQAWEWLITWK